MMNGRTDERTVKMGTHGHTHGKLFSKEGYIFGKDEVLRVYQNRIYVGSTYNVSLTCVRCTILHRLKPPTLKWKPESL